MFASTRGGETSIWVLPSDGGEAAQRFSRGEYKDDSHPDWSPDGQLVLFVRRRPEAPPLLFTARYEDRGFTESRICFEGDLTGIPKDEPKWSPDGNWIAFETWPDGVDHNIAVMTSSCTLYAEITSDPASDYDVAWRSAP
jgi:Tol biopolymer transport system component